MIVKIKSHKRLVFGRILSYMMNDKGRLFDKEGRSFAITHNLKGNSIEEWERQFKTNEQYRLIKRTDSVILTHEILSWHREDARYITIAKMETMAREYIRQRNPNGMYVVTPHFDKNHFHIHICASGVEYKTGKSLRLSKPDLQKLKKDIQQFQIDKFPELSKSLPKHGEKKKTLLSEKEYQIKLRTGRETEKEKVIVKLKTCYMKANSKETFFALLKEGGLETYERSGNITGVVHNNYKFRFSRLGFTNEKFEEFDRLMQRGNGLRKSRKQIKEKGLTR